MTDESATMTPDAPVIEEGASGDAPEAKKKIKQSVDIQDIGPCKKHIKVTVLREDIEKNIQEKYKELVGESSIPGFRPGKAPRKIVTQRFRKDVFDKVKGEILLSSLEQLAEDFDVAPLSPPNLDPANLFIPEEGDFVYEFDVEVRPHFDLPEYKSLKLRRPIRTFSEADIDEEQKKILSQEGQLVPKDGPAERGDYIVVDMVTTFAGEKVGEAPEITLRIDDTMSFKDGVATKFGEQVIGVKAGEKRNVDISMTESVSNPQLKGQTILAALDIKDVKRLRLPEMDDLFLERYECKTIDQFREKIRLVLDRRLEYAQRQSIREQVLALITSSATWELPQDLLRRQARNALSRRVMEMKESGISEDEIKGRQRMLERDVLSTTAQSMKEHFVLQKIAEQEKLEIDQGDVDQEIDRIAEVYKESPRRIRAQLERDGQLETLAAQLIERKALNRILETAEYEDVATDRDGGMATVDTQAVQGEMHDPTAVPPAVEDANPEA